MPTTPLGLVYPDHTGTARVWEHVQALAESTDTYLTSRNTGLVQQIAAARQAAVTDAVAQAAAALTTTVTTPSLAQTTAVNTSQVLMVRAGNLVTLHISANIAYNPAQGQVDLGTMTVPPPRGTLTWQDDTLHIYGTLTPTQTGVLLSVRGSTGR